MTKIPPLKDLTQLFILGDSYSDIGWTYPDCPVPTPEDPLGMSDPGENVEWCLGEFQDNWVVHLSNSRAELSHDLCIYDVAKGGDFTKNLQAQFDQLNEMVESGNERVEENALLVLWIGINDVAVGLRSTSFDRQMALIDQVLDGLYNLGLRYLILIDVPPRRPSNAPVMKIIQTKIKEWNDLLPLRMDKWLQKSNTSGRIFSSHQILSDILRNPTKYGFDEEDPKCDSGGIWVDGLHLTSDVHETLAEEIEGFLGGL